MKYKYLYGPVPSWRLGSSLGVDPISQKNKICSFGCVYCQLGQTKEYSTERKVFIPSGEIVSEIRALPPGLQIDYITFSGAGEPTLALNLGEMIRAVKKERNEKTAVITNSSLLSWPDVMADVSEADFVIAKFDACSQEGFVSINNPAAGVTFEKIISSLSAFRKFYKKKFALQIMFIDENKAYAAKIAEIARHIKPDEVQLNTPLRPCGVKPVLRSEMERIEKIFKMQNTISVYKAEKKQVESISSKDTLKRRGKT